MRDGVRRTVCGVRQATGGCTVLPLHLVIEWVEWVEWQGAAAHIVCSNQAVLASARQAKPPPLEVAQPPGMYPCHGAE